MTASPLDFDDYGLPLFRARSAFTGMSIWLQEWKAARSRFTMAWPDWPLGDCWRLETFIPQIRKSEGWASWESQSASPFYKAEAEMQNAFYQTSLALGKKLLNGELTGVGHEGNLSGRLVPIPPDAWILLQVPMPKSQSHETPFQNWRLGHVVGGGFNLCGVRIRDNLGMPIEEARLAYGPAEAAALVSRALADPEIVVDECPATSDLDRRMSSLPSPLSSDVRRSDYDAAVRVLNAKITELLAAGKLVQVGMEPNILVRQPYRQQAVSDERPRDAPAQKNSPSRRSRGRSYTSSDAALVEEMRAIIDRGDEDFPYNAARIVVGRAAGAGSDESKVKRLTAKYKERYPES